MKKILYIIIFLITDNTFAQQVEDDLYGIAINSIAIEVMNKYPSLKNGDTLFLKLPYLSAFIKPSKSASLYLNYCDADWLGAYRSIPVFFLQPINNKGSELVMRFDIMYYRSAEKDINWSPAGGGYVKYAFDCKKNRFEILETVIAP